MYLNKESINFTAVTQIHLNDFWVHILFPLAGFWRMVQWSISPSLAAKVTVIFPYNQAVLLGTPHNLLKLLNLKLCNWSANQFYSKSGNLAHLHMILPSPL